MGLFGKGPFIRPMLDLSEATHLDVLAPGSVVETGDGIQLRRTSKYVRDSSEWTTLDGSAAGTGPFAGSAFESHRVINILGFCRLISLGDEPMPSPAEPPPPVPPVMMFTQRAERSTSPTIPTSPTRSSRTAAAQSGATMFEYKVESFGAHPEIIQTVMNRYASEGWRVISTALMDSGPQMFIVTFERQVTGRR